MFQVGSPLTQQPEDRAVSQERRTGAAQRETSSSRGERLEDRQTIPEPIRARLIAAWTAILVAEFHEDTIH